MDAIAGTIGNSHEASGRPLSTSSARLAAALADLALRSQLPQSSHSLAGCSIHNRLPLEYYKPLDFVNFEFRLLRLVEDGGSEDAIVCCELEHAYLDDPPEYHALSYVNFLSEQFLHTSLTTRVGL